jgi:hypothetical protein
MNTLSKNVEYQKAINFLKLGCKCGCSNQLPHKEFAQLRFNFQNLSKPEQDAFVMGQLFIMKDRGTTATSPRLKKKERTNQRFVYLFDHEKFICQQTYLNMLGVSHIYIERFRKYWFLKGVIPRVHGNTSRIPQWKTKMNIDQEIKERLRNFILDYAETHGLPNPGKSKRATNSIIFLPTEMSCKSVHREFIANRTEDDKLKNMKYGIFLKLWHQLTPQIKFMNPRTDLCNTCHQLRNEIHSCSKSEAEKAELKKICKSS